MGTICDDGRVSKIGVNNLNLVGSIPEEIGLLTDLHNLELGEFMFLVSGRGALLSPNKAAAHLLSLYFLPTC
jgi:hypothetical protein